MIRQPQQQSTRGPLLPFDQISRPGSPPSRNRSIQELMAYMPFISIQKQNYKRKQHERLIYLDKINDRSYDKPSLKDTLLDVFDGWLPTKLHLFTPEQLGILLWYLWGKVGIFSCWLLFCSIFWKSLSPCFLLTKFTISRNQYHCIYSQHSLFLGLNYFFISVLLVDMLLIRFNLAFYRYGRCITTRSQIIFQYLKKQFIFDMLAWLSYLLYIALDIRHLIMLKLIFYLKIFQLININSQIIRQLNQHRIRGCIYKIFRMIMMIWFIATWVSSIYFYMDYQHYVNQDYYFQTGQLWLTNSNSVHNYNLIQKFPEWYYWYQFALYWSFQTSATVGYGEITPRNPQEAMYCNFVILLNTVIFAFYINTIWQIIAELQQYTDTYTENCSNLRMYLKTKEITVNLKKKVRDYLQEKWIYESADILEEEEQSFLQNLSDDLRHELSIAIKGRILNQGLATYFIQNGLTAQWDLALKQLIFLIQEEQVGKATVIYRMGEENNNLYYLMKGKISLSVTQLGIGREFYIPQVFGSNSFMTQSRRLETATAQSLCSLQILPLHTFISCLKQHPLLFSKFCEQRQDLLLYNKSVIDDRQVCLNCSQIHHHSSCPSYSRWRHRILRPMHWYRKRSQEVERAHAVRRVIKSSKMVGLQFDIRETNFEKVANFETYRPHHNIK